MPRAVPEVQIMEAKVAVVVNVGGRPPVYKTRIVRNSRTGALAEVTMHEFPPIDPGDLGTPLRLQGRRKVRADHPAVQACPGGFKPFED